MRRIALQLFRASVIVVLAVMARNHRIRLQIDNDFPVTLKEVRPSLPAAESLRFDDKRMGLEVLDAKRGRIGYVVRTQPVCKDIVGYSGPTDAMLVFDANWIVRGAKVRRSLDTYTHFFDVSTDKYFLKLWEGKSWDQIADMDLKKAGVEGVSGATLTSMAVARSFVFRLKRGGSIGTLPPLPPMAIHAADIGLVLALGAALVIAFTRLRGYKFLRGLWQLILIGGVGLLNGQLLSVALFGGWSASGIAWRSAPGLALLAAAALLVPWASKKAFYCQYFCPHGAAQEWIHRLAPKSLRIKLPAQIAAGLRWAPALLLLVAVLVTMLALPFELSDIEPFDAYLLSAWNAAAVVAIAGLVAAIFVPMAYCKFGCPTGALLEFIRARGPQDRFGKRDLFAIFLVAATVWMYVDYDPIKAWIVG